MRILIESIAHEEQRYDTCGDWFESAGPLTLHFARGPTLRVVVSALTDEREMLLLAVHELIEAILCQHAGVSARTVDEFDLHFKGAGEPGDDPLSPYYAHHQFATHIEREVADLLGVDWDAYGKHIEELNR